LIIYCIEEHCKNNLVNRITESAEETERLLTKMHKHKNLEEWDYDEKQTLRFFSRRIGKCYRKNLEDKQRRDVGGILCDGVRK